VIMTQSNLGHSWVLQGTGDSVTGYRNVTVDGLQLGVGDQVKVVPSAALQGAIVLDAATLVDLDKRAAIHGTDRVGYLRWVLTGK
jgi:hypothetical protein